MRCDDSVQYINCGCFLVLVMVHCLCDIKYGDCVVVQRLHGRS